MHSPFCYTLYTSTVYFKRFSITSDCCHVRCSHGLRVNVPLRTTQGCDITLIRSQNNLGTVCEMALVNKHGDASRPYICFKCLHPSTRFVRSKDPPRGPARCKVIPASVIHTKPQLILNARES
ncbi:hypothetical protein J6590_047406 [Homalodisca vitripennis]|nr:hypothetical protein J6590_047406 [Homalodisca vitripennis]